MSMLMFKGDIYGDNIVKRLKEKEVLFPCILTGISGKKSHEAYVIDAEKCSPELWQVRKQEIADFGLLNMDENHKMIRSDLPDAYLNGEAKLFEVIIDGNHHLSWFRNYLPDSSPVTFVSAALPKELLYYTSKFGVERRTGDCKFIRNNIPLHLSREDIKRFLKQYA